MAYKQPKTWDEMTGHERNALVAEEVMGWHEPFIIDPAGELWGHHPTKGYQAVPLVTTDHNAAYEMEEEIKRRGLSWHYGKQLHIDIVCQGEHLSSTFDECFALAHATLDQRCLAALRAMGVEI